MLRGLSGLYSTIILVLLGLTAVISNSIAIELACDACVKNTEENRIIKGELSTSTDVGESHKVCIYTNYYEPLMWRSFNYGIYSVVEELSLKAHFFLKQELEAFQDCLGDADAMVVLGRDAEGTQLPKPLSKNIVKYQLLAEKVVSSDSETEQEAKYLLVPYEQMVKKIVDHVDRKYAAFPLKQKMAIVLPVEMRSIGESFLTQWKATKPVSHSSLSIVELHYSENTYLSQYRKIYDILAADPPDIIVASSVASTAAVRIIENNESLQLIDIYAIGTDSEVIRNLSSGRISVAVTEWPIQVGRILMYQVYSDLNELDPLPRLEMIPGLIDPLVLRNNRKLEIRLPYSFRPKTRYE